MDLKRFMFLLPFPKVTSALTLLLIILYVFLLCTVCFCPEEYL